MCPGEIFLEALPGSAGPVRVRCTAKTCKREGGWVFHDFDLATGEFTTIFAPYRNPKELLGGGD